MTEFVAIARSDGGFRSEDLCGRKASLSQVPVLRADLTVSMFKLAALVKVPNHGRSRFLNSRSSRDFRFISAATHSSGSATVL